MAETHRFSVSVAGAVIREDGRLLAIKRRDNGQWEPPGGVVEPGETLHQALIREIREETGLTVEPGPLTGVYQNMERDIVALVFRCHPRTDETPRASPESSEARWLDQQEIDDLLEEAYALRMLDALQHRSPSIRTHDGHQLIGPDAAGNPTAHEPS